MSQSRRTRSRSMSGNDDGSLSTLGSMCDSSAAVWPVEYAPLREAAGHLLLDVQLQLIPCTAEQLCSPINTIGDSAGRDDVIPVTEDVIKKAFRNCGNEFLFSLQSLVIKEGGDQVVLTRIGQPVGSYREGNRKKITDFCVYPSEIDYSVRIKAATGEKKPSPHPLNIWSRSLQIPIDVRHRLHSFLKLKKEKKTSRGPRSPSRKKRKLSEPSSKRVSPSLDETTNEKNGDANDEEIGGSYDSMSVANLREQLKELKQ
eukprot:CAMPEP_0183733012 /NCGR_PEP_ID=MMETSP0737-20130205/39934_1 /TAXON_ID=385413 /ORGANISM="Thalassiosira miniscula, Strain CCMP1093" /LENGTH=257 /DNA_ID=CAMNT_0025966175 /DNA_START=85 /DNA_END=856 /DNA_ORIENTATION=+